MGDDDGWSRDGRAEVGDAAGDVGIALAFGRAEVPETRLALAGDGHRAGGKLGVEVAFVEAEADLDEARIDSDVGERLADCGADEVHGLAGAAQRGDIPGEVRCDPTGAGQQGAEKPAIQRGLLAAVGVERDVLAALVAAFGVPVGLAVADEIEFGPDQSHRLSLPMPAPPTNPIPPLPFKTKPGP